MLFRRCDGVGKRVGCKARASCAAIITLTLCACGGGGGGGGTPTNNNGGSGVQTPPAIVFSAPSNVTKVEGAGVGSNPISEFVIKLNAPLPEGRFAAYTYSTNGIVLVGINVLDELDTNWDVVVHFEDPSELGPGVYTDTLSIGLCTDIQCTDVEPDTVSTVAITYTVTGQKPPPAEVVASTTSANVQAMAYTDTDLSVTIDLSYLNVQPNASFSAETTSGYVGVSGATIESISQTAARLHIRFKNASTLAPGTYDDAVTVNVCAKCPRHVVGSPLTIATRYTITNTAEGPNGYTIKVLDQSAVDLAWDEVGSKLYLAVPDTAEQYANSILAVDPVTQSFGPHSVVGNSPRNIAISDDGQFIYVARRDSSDVQRLNLPDLSPSLTIPMGSDDERTFYPGDIQVAPGAPETFAVVLHDGSFGRAHGIAIFDATVMRPQNIVYGALEPDYYSLQWGGAQTLYAGKLSETGAIGTYDVDADGLTFNSSHNVPQNWVLGGYSIHFGSGHLYLDPGARIDPETGTVMGIYSPPGSAHLRGILPDGQHRRVFALARHAFSHTLEAYDMETYERIATVPLEGLDVSFNSPVKLIRWSDDGLAFATSDRKIVLVNGRFVAP